MNRCDSVFMAKTWEMTQVFIRRELGARCGSARNPSTQEVKAGRSGVQRQPGLQELPSLQKKKERENK